MAQNPYEGLFERRLNLVFNQIFKRFDFTNFKGNEYTVSDTGSADTEFTINHKLGYTPTRWVCIDIDGDGYVYRDSGGTAWTTSNAYLKCSVANAAVILLIY
jgi:hypothetical protein